MRKQLSWYGLIGIFNTLVHWSVFGFLIYFGASQTIGNGAGFAVAVTTSYFLNARFTFEKKPQKKGYLYFIFGMGALSLVVGKLGDIYLWPGLVTLVLFSLISLVLGFLWSKYIVFKADKIDKADKAADL